MTAENKGKRGIIWLAESLRFTAFPLVTETFEGSTWWEKVLGTTPDTEIKQKSGTYQAQGAFDSGRVTLTSDPLRIDWLYSPLAVKNVLELESVPNVGPYSEAVSRFGPLMQKWLNESSPNLQRLAYGATLLFPLETKAEGYRRISEYLQSIQVDPEGSSELFYQINRIRNSKTKISDLKVNRLSKWSVSILMIKKRNVSIEAPSSEVIALELPTCRVELDINTVPDPKIVFSRGRQVTVLNELMDLAKEISEEGDIK